MNNIKISISGDLGSGKSVLSKQLKEELGFEVISIGVIQRELATKYGMDALEFNKFMETHPEIDEQCDEMVTNYGKEDRGLILDSRLAWHFIPHSFKVHLTVDNN
ncbi:MAG: AAA family ATPase, partial [Bacteroidales bacterium]|nr:AAA family ATPase [Bacteroidales bacterium]